MAIIEPRGRIVPVLLSGGTGSRLWPLSRETYPKQLLSLLGDNTLLQQTALRVDDGTLFTDPVVIANAEHRFAIGEQLRAVGIERPNIVLEPFGRNTAPAVAIAALLVGERDPDAVILAMPVDHWVHDHAAFRAAISPGITAASYGRFVLFGVRPSSAATGFGYIRMGDELEAAPHIRSVASFIEKPDLVTVERLLACDEHVWNSGIFLLPARKFIDELAKRAPEILAACRNALAGARRDLDFLRLDARAFEACPSISIDYAIMEKTDNAVVVPATFDWSDVGSWSALWSMAEKDRSGNVVIGDAVVEDVSGCYVRGDGQLVAALGVEDLVIATSPDVVLVTSRKRDQDVGKLVERLKANGHRSATQTHSVHRPWGYYQSIHAGERFQVKRITVNPGAKLSLQKHYHRAEHWVVVNGTAIVTRDDEEILLRENESIFVPLGCMHRLENPGKVPLNLIEVQSGSYLGEDDIVRVQDIYDRV
ncbi:mannose-1-phosphate guanylyltransferase/mannose-6-phosphate isomerase [Bradyrhizobium sp. BWA-3-5]|uniref:mannose-1-phosphate guanylyltransferase/mannose-6-phosphate isomerase n=1 Tax=Bradyrhizobium sp. BWA-3-5 TaxID=3080013 RepID=UPI00293F3067|nr:mannose-1-phosphate guanylyltransferase/mannose-6-phosphate isomerase [Bradyrhizobium sp. BWA-3-5]WOH67160.1 mannose-1-phosphate guanylyltransferase/mannose-6-phosphate isomerase [Bradyrhizobium sp. BWA-3-5]